MPFEDRQDGAIAFSRYRLRCKCILMTSKKDPDHICILQEHTKRFDRVCVLSSRRYLEKWGGKCHTLEAGSNGERGQLLTPAVSAWGQRLPFPSLSPGCSLEGIKGPPQAGASQQQSTKQASPVPCNFWLYSVLSDWLLRKVPWSPAAAVLSTTGSVLLLSPMYSLFLSRAKFLLLPPAPSFPGQSMLAVASLAWGRRWQRGP